MSSESPPSAAPTPIVAPNLAELPGIRHGFFTSIGGVSSGLYASLNCGLGSSDKRPKVLENRARVTANLGARQLVTVHQAHTAIAIFVDGPVGEKDMLKADAVVTNVPGLAVAVLTADCAPVLLCDPEAKLIAAVHAGWRGAVGGVIEAALAAMRAEGAKSERIAAAIGPCIGQAAYEVGPEFEADLLSRDKANARYFMTPAAGGKAHFDLEGFVAGRLLAAGITNISQTGRCTFGDDSFFSYRRSQSRFEPDYGRQISAIVVS